MLSEEKLKTLPQRALAYQRKAQDFLTKNQVDWFIIRKGSDEWTAWSRYFSSFDLRPFGMRTCDSITVPAQWPEWFDGDYHAADVRQALTEPQRRERYERVMRGRYGQDVKLRPRDDWEWGQWANGNVPPPFEPRDHDDPNSYEVMVRKHGRPIGRFEQGTKYARMAGRHVDLPKSSWKSMTGDDLRTEYARLEVA